MNLTMGSGSVLLYHGSKSGIVGDIKPISRELCDFGKGFYMGTESSQALTLICNFPNAKLYTVRINMTGLRILEKVSVRQNRYAGRIVEMDVSLMKSCKEIPDYEKDPQWI